MPTIYAISDLHLSFGVNKPMNVFGKKWNNYEQRIKENWERRVKSDDYVLLPGDLSWGLTLKESRKDFEFINSLPGRKIISKGNHDYYFSTKSKLYNFFKENNFDTIDILHNNSYVIGDYVVCGTRGWGKTESGDATLDKKITAREEIRLRLSLEEGKKTGKKIIVAMHYPPFYSKFCSIMKEYGVVLCIYGHLHGYGTFMIKEGIIYEIEYKMVSCDHTGFDVVKLFDF